jgi:peptidoglycan biosynthesis protein MviN/MurJ (putative lipid II flippase)
MRWARWMFIAGFAVFIIGWVLAPVIVKLLFERGAFSAEDTTAVTGVMRYAILQIPFYFAGRVFYSLLSSQALYFSIGPAVAVCVLVKISANYLLVPRFGLGGLQLATTLMYAGFFSVLWVIVRKGNYGSA